MLEVLPFSFFAFVFLMQIPCVKYQLYCSYVQDESFSWAINKKSSKCLINNVLRLEKKHYLLKNQLLHFLYYFEYVFMEFF